MGLDILETKTLELRRLREGSIDADRAFHTDLANYAKHFLIEKAAREAKGTGNFPEAIAVEIGSTIFRGAARLSPLLNPKNPYLWRLSKGAEEVEKKRTRKEEEIKARAEARSREIDALDSDEIFHLFDLLMKLPIGELLETDWHTRSVMRPS